MADGYTRVFGTLRVAAKKTAEASGVVSNGRFKVLKVVQGKLVSNIDKTFRSTSDGTIEFYVLRDCVAYLWAQAEGFDRSEDRGSPFTIPDVDEIDLDDLVPATSTPTLPAAAQAAFLSHVASVLDHSDMPASYVGQAGKIPVVNEDEDALEFVDPSGGGAWGEIGGTLPDQTDLVAALTAKADASALMSEASTRAAADTAEATARASADSALTSSLGAVSTAVSAVDAALDVEEAARASADTTLQTNIDAEASARTAAITSASTADRARANHTGTQSADTVTDGTTNKAFTATERTKLAGVATGATANSSDATLLGRGNHTGTQAASTVSDFNSAALTAAPAETVNTVGALVSGATVLTVPADADLLGLSDSAASNVLKKFSWANLKAALGAIYQTILTIGNGLSLSSGTVAVDGSKVLMDGSVLPAVEGEFPETVITLGEHRVLRITGVGDETHNSGRVIIDQTSHDGIISFNEGAPAVNHYSGALQLRTEDDPGTLFTFGAKNVTGSLISGFTGGIDNFLYFDSAGTSLQITLGALAFPLLTNLSSQDRLLGFNNTSKEIGNVTLGSGISLSAGNLSLSAALAAIAALTPANDDVIQRKAGAWTNRTPAQLKTDLAVNNVDNTSDATKNSATATLTNKTLALGSNTVSGTTAQFNTALNDNDFATLAGSETLTNKTLTTPTIASFTNATHDHTNAAGGGTLSASAVALGSVLNVVQERVLHLASSGANSGTGETDLSSFSIPAGSLAVGKILRVTVFVSFAGNANTKTVKFYLGSTSIQLPNAAASSGGNAMHVLFIVGTGASTQHIFGRPSYAATNTGNESQNSNQYQAGAENSAAGITTKVTGQSNTASSDLLLRLFMVEALN